ncbi:MAG TPA: leucyl/phenylalanyl-tRNA--protein transferase [Bdellovibrionales bacterium]|nr:leucyl/phenylalanyl-tRNA--protein transferase [Bdellovibrionales bacterium]
MKLFAEKLTSFPDPRLSLDEGIVDLSDDLRVERLLEAYSFGIFPWPHQDLPTLWYSPERRGVLDFKDFHVPRSLQKTLKQSSWTCTFNQAFDEVLEACAQAPRPQQDGTWITSKLLTAYRAFHRAGYAHSLEVWSGEKLIGGLYGVYVGGVFGGESMFHREADASKFGLVKLVEFLKGQGQKFMDIQMVTPLLERFGGKYIPRGQFLLRLEQAKKSARAVDFKI